MAARIRQVVPVAAALICLLVLSVSAHALQSMHQDEPDVSEPLLATEPPWWRSEVAYGTYGLILVGLGVRFELRHRNHLAAEARYAHRLEREVEHRTREIAERNTELASLNHQLEAASYTDALTGLMNRRYLADQIDRDVALVIRAYTDESAPGDPPRDLLFLMLDIDGLKGINDTYGHAAGDRVLVQVGEMLTRVSRRSDTLVRWGGDEFLLVGHYTDRFMAERLAEHLRSAITQHTFGLGGRQSAHLSCSIGFAMYPFVERDPTALNWEQVVHMADRGLYDAKYTGRNRWTGVLSGRNADPSILVGRMDENLETLEAEQILSLRRREPDESASAKTPSHADDNKLATVSI